MASTAPLVVAHPDDTNIEHTIRHNTEDVDATSSTFLDESIDPAMPPAPFCFNMLELATASSLRAQLQYSPSAHGINPALAYHISQGLAYTTGAALGETAPSREQCHAAFILPNRVGLSAGGRAWSKHAHRSGSDAGSEESKRAKDVKGGWWGRAHGSVSNINTKSLELFDRVMNAASWRNLHWLPHQVLVYEVRVPEGYGMRWSQDRSGVQVVPTPADVPGDSKTISLPVSVESAKDVEGTSIRPALEQASTPEGLDVPVEDPPADDSSTHVPDWIFRGFVEPMMENGHEVGWRH